MAKFTPLLGNISGKLAGNVFARNKGGFYIRTFRSPVNPATADQTFARSRFSSSVGAWHSLEDYDKAQWNSFALSLFKPKFPQIGVAYSGFNAYVSLNNQLKTMATFGGTPTFTGMTVTPAPYEITSALPPALALSGNILIEGLGPSGGDLACGLTLNQARVNKTGNVLNIRLGTSVPYDVANPPIFNDASSGEKVGFVFVMSKAGTQVNQFAQNPKWWVVGATQLLDTATVTTPGSEIVGTLPMRLTSFKNNPSVGEVVTVTCFMVSESGQTFKIGDFRDAVA